MIPIRLICVGRLKEKFYIEAAEEYRKRLSRFCRLEILELPEQRLPEAPAPAEIGRALERQVASPGWQAGIGKPYASTYLNNARWVEAEARPIIPDPPGEGRSYGWQ